MSQVRVLPPVAMMGVAQLVERSKNVIIMGLVNSFILVRVIPNKVTFSKRKSHYIFLVIIREETSDLFNYEELS